MSWTINVIGPNKDEELVDANLINSEANYIIDEDNEYGGIFYFDHHQLDEDFQNVTNYLTEDSCYNDVKGVMVVFVIPGGGSNTIQITKGTNGNSAMEYVNAAANYNGGAIIIIDSSINVLGGKPVKGEVKNGLGGL